MMSRNKTYPLPRANQELHTQYFKKKVEVGILKEFVILWVGTPLPCRFRSDDVKSVIEAKHVFVLKKDDTFEYACTDTSGSFFKLAKKYFSSCFPSITVTNIPRNNVMKMKLTKHDTVVLPFIPDSFFQSKLQKTNRKKRKIYPTASEGELATVERIDYKKTYPSWTLLNNQDIKDDTLKTDVMLLLREIIKYVDSNKHHALADPFESVESVEDLKSNPVELAKLKTIVSFVYHYCRAELGCFNDQYAKFDRTSVGEWIEDLRNSAST